MYTVLQNASKKKNYETNGTEGPNGGSENH
jgi:hypothetical protein